MRRLFIVPSRERGCSLAECPPGLFLFEGSLGFKSKYLIDGEMEVFCMDSGKHFWGHTGTRDQRRKLIVQPCESKWVTE